MTQTGIEEIAKHWLLNTAVEFPRNLNYILPEVRGEGLNASAVPGCKSQCYAECLLELFNAEMIRFSSEFPEDDSTCMAGVSRILKRSLESKPIPRFVRKRDLGMSPPAPIAARTPQARFELTHLGGQAWERLAKPDWSRFFDQSSDYLTGDMVSPDLDLLMARLGWFPELSGEEIDIQSIKVEEHSDYQALYWKRLPFVYRATFNCRIAEARWTKDHNYPIEPDWFRRWWPTTVSFFTEPWELPGWPAT